jgi:hypothetical protein
LPNQEEIEKAREKLAETLDWFKKCDIEALRRDELGIKMSFEEAIPYVERIVALYRNLLDCTLDDLPVVTMHQITSAGSATIAIIGKIGSFDPESFGQNPIPERTQIIQQIRDRWETDFPAVTPVLAYATKSSADFQRLEREARGTLSELSESKKQLDKTTKEILSSMTSALGEVQDAAKNAGIAQHATHFNDEANLSRNIAIGWLVASVIFGLVAFDYVVSHVEPALSTLTNPTAMQLVQASIPRLLIIFLLTFGMIWSAKNFTSSAHNYVVNRHRRNALASFQTFVEGASKPDVKDAVLMQATHAIFTPQDSGFAKGEIPNPASQVVEVFRGMKE